MNESHDQFNVKRETLDAVKYVPAERLAYFGNGYLNEGRFIDYWHTYKLVLETGCKSVLEIGIGNGMVTWLLRENGIMCHTVDIEPALEPDTVADIRRLPFEDDLFDTVVSCEVLEHLPFDQFEVCLRELRRVCRGHAVISLPHVIPCWSVIARLPFVGGVWGSILVPRMKAIDLSDHPEHFWSVGSKGCSDRVVADAMRAAGWKIEKAYRPGFNKDHKFYLLRKAEGGEVGTE